MEDLPLAITAGDLQVSLGFNPEDRHTSAGKIDIPGLASVPPPHDTRGPLTCLVRCHQQLRGPGPPVSVARVSAAIVYV